MFTRHLLTVLEEALRGLKALAASNISCILFYETVDESFL